MRVRGLKVSLAAHEEGLRKLSSLLSKADTSQGRRSRKRVMSEQENTKFPKESSFVADTWHGGPQWGELLCGLIGTVH